MYLAYHWQDEKDRDFVAFLNIIGGSPATMWEPAESPEIEIETRDDRYLIFMERKHKRRLLPDGVAEKVATWLVENKYDDILEEAAGVAEAVEEDRAFQKRRYTPWGY